MQNPEIDIAVVNIMGREFKIKCPKNKINELQKAATYLNEKMQDVQRGDKFITIDRIAITAALNIAHELILEKQHFQAHAGDISELNQRLFTLKNKLNQALINIK